MNATINHKGKKIEGTSAELPRRVGEFRQDTREMAFFTDEHGLVIVDMMDVDVEDEAQRPL